VTAHAGHTGHDHRIGPGADRRYLVTALVLLAGFMVLEVVVAFVSGSLALLSDAGTCSPMSGRSPGRCGR